MHMSMYILLIYMCKQCMTYAAGVLILITSPLAVNVCCPYNEVDLQTFKCVSFGEGLSR